MLEPSSVNPVSCALFILLAFTTAGVAQTWWFKSPRAARFAIPLDGGLTFRSRRLFGPNKTLKGFVVMVPTAATVFAVFGAISGAIPSVAETLWPLTVVQWGLLGF